MNVLAGSGLVGRITAIGSDWARVETIIDDNINVAGAVLSTGDNCIVAGSISAMNSSYHINMSNLEDEAGAVVSGEAVVTSNISNKFVPGIMIGYIDEITDYSPIEDLEVEVIHEISPGTEITLQ